MRPTALLLLALLCSCRAEQPARPLESHAEGPNPDLTIQERRLLVAATIALPPSAVTDSLPEPGSRGAQLVSLHCAQCHAIPSPTLHSAQDWPTVATRMLDRAAMMRGQLDVVTPDDEDRSELLGYLVKHASR